MTSAQIIFQRHVYDGTWHHEFVGSVPITGIDDYRIEIDWSFPPPENAFAWPECSLMPGEYEWYVLVTVNGETNTMYDQPELTVYPPVSVNARATFTRDPVVTVTYFNRPGEKYFQISNSLWQWPDTWEEIPVGDHAVSWTIPSDEDGSQMVYMRFADSPGGPRRRGAMRSASTRRGRRPLRRLPRPRTRVAPRRSSSAARTCTANTAGSLSRSGRRAAAS